MTDYIVIADMGDAAFIIFVIIASIASQIAKASKRQRPGQGKTLPGPKKPTDATPSPFGSADDQLRDFLETLATGKTPEERQRTSPVSQKTVTEKPRPAARPQPVPAATGKPTQVKQASRTGREAVVRHPASKAPAAARKAELRPTPTPTIKPIAPVKRERPVQPTVSGSKPLLRQQPKGAALTGPSSVARALSGEQDLRNAIVLREILGPPLALREAGATTEI